MTEESKKYEVTDEIKDLFVTMKACEDCRDKAIMLVFNTKKAIHYAKEQVKARDKAWKLVLELYPELVNKPIKYLHDEEVVILTDSGGQS